MNEYKMLTLDNLDEEHICCAIGDKKHQCGVTQKKEWLKARINEGHVFRKANVNGKVFIEYAPLEYAWTPIQGNQYMYVYCLWVAGSFKGHGYGKELLEYAIADSKQKGMLGLCTLSSKKKKPYLADKKFFTKYGFQVVDTIGEYELLALSFQTETPQPYFSDGVKTMHIPSQTFTIFYSPSCPFTANCIKEVSEFAKESNIPIHIECIDTLEKAKNMPCIFHHWANFKDGKYLSNLLLNKNIISKLLSES